MQINGIGQSRVDTIWDTICFHGATQPTFTTREIEQSLIRYDGFKPKTTQLYVNRFVNWAMEHPDEFSGPKSKLIRVYTGVWRLDDNEER